jgi:hypothetical protein
MHRSKLSTFLIDCRTDDVASAADFWSKALGRAVLPARPDDDRYRTLESTPAEPVLQVQRVDHESRVHLDIESDDVEAEVARLEALGRSGSGAPPTCAIAAPESRATTAGYLSWLSLLPRRLYRLRSACRASASVWH